MKTAPLCLFVYNRIEHTKKTIASLKLNKLCLDTDLYIFADGSKNNLDQHAVFEVQSFIKKVSGFKNIHIIKRSRNYGLSKNIIDGVTQIINEHERVIVLEDDTIVSSYFLDYMNKALEKYEKTENVISIHGYIYPIQKELPESFFLKGADCWGWATWKRGWSLFEKDGKKLYDELQEKNLAFDFDFFGSHPYMKMLKNQIDGKIDSWAIRWYASAFLNNKLTLYPGVSFVHNIGNDSSGTHCTTNNQYDVQLADKENTFWPKKVQEDIHAKKIIAKYFRSTRKNPVKTIFYSIKERIYEIFN